LFILYHIQTPPSIKREIKNLEKKELKQTHRITLLYYVTDDEKIPRQRTAFRQNRNEGRNGILYTEHEQKGEDRHLA
jgi:hypothetical protein